MHVRGRWAQGKPTTHPIFLAIIFGVSTMPRARFLGDDVNHTSVCALREALLFLCGDDEGIPVAQQQRMSLPEFEWGRYVALLRKCSVDNDVLRLTMAQW